MSDDTYTFDSARVRLEQIAAEVRKKDTSLEKSLDLLEEGVRLANQCTELIDATQWRSTLEEAAAEGAESREADGQSDAELEPGDIVIVEEVVGEQLDGGGIVEDVVIVELEVEGEETAGESPAGGDNDGAVEGAAEESGDDDIADSAWASDPGHDDDERS